MTTLEQRVTKLEADMFSTQAVLEAIVDKIDANHAEVLSQIKSNHYAVMKELGRIATGGAIN